MILVWWGILVIASIINGLAWWWIGRQRGVQVGQWWFMQCDYCVGLFAGELPVKVNDLEVHKRCADKARGVVGAYEPKEISPSEGIGETMGIHEGSEQSPALGGRPIDSRRWPRKRETRNRGYSQ